MNRNFAVVLVQPERGLNIGFTARTMMNFGVTDLRLVKPRKYLLKPAARFASHASRIVDKARIFDDLPSAIEDSDLSVGTTALRAGSLHNVLRTLGTPRELANNLAGTTRGTTSLVFGREGSGLKNSELELCDFTVTIPTSLGYPTMNVSHAVAVVLYELTIPNTGTSSGIRRVATRHAHDRLVNYFQDLLESSGIPDQRQTLCVRAWRNILGRSVVSTREASLLIGALRVVRLHREAAGRR